jgi:hypothetical protein
MTSLRVFAILLLLSVFFAIACSDDTTGTDPNNGSAPSTGSLEITITGLPDGTDANVRLEGTGAPVTIVASTYLDTVEVGTYTLIAQTVSVDGVDLLPTPASQSVEVRSGQTTTVTVRYDRPGDEGSLRVEIRGLPEDVPADVTVAGPNAFFAQIEETTTFEDLAIGTYTVVAEEVLREPAIYVPDDRERQVSVGSVGQASTRVDYAAVPGAMEIVVVGLPPTLTPRITVTGPEGYDSGVLNGATTLNDLTPGDYQVSAEDIQAGQVRLRAGTQQVVVASRETVVVTVTFGPPWEWLDQFGNSAFTYAFSVDIDDEDNVFVAGYTLGRLGSDASAGGVDVFVARYNPQGQRQWLRQFGTSGNDYAHHIAVDPTGHLYVVGLTDGAFEGFENAGEFDAFIARLDGNGQLSWVRQFGSARHDGANGVAVDALTNSAYVVGYIDGLAGQLGADGTDAFIARYSTSGEQLWLTRIDSGSRDEARSVAVDSKGDAFVAGITAGALTADANEDFDAFVARFDRDGERLWVSQFGTSGYDSAHGISIDFEDHVYVGGMTSGQFSGQQHQGGFDAFLARLDVSGGLAWVTQFGTDADDLVRGLGHDRLGNPYVIGYTAGVFPDNTRQGVQDGFVARFDGEGDATWIRQFGTIHSDEPLDIAINSQDHLIICGQTTGDFPGHRLSGLHDAFIFVFDPTID